MRFKELRGNRKTKADMASEKSVSRISKPSLKSNLKISLVTSVPWRVKSRILAIQLVTEATKMAKNLPRFLGNDRLCRGKATDNTKGDEKSEKGSERRHLDTKIQRFVVFFERATIKSQL